MKFCKKKKKIVNFSESSIDKKNNIKMKKIVTAIHNFQLSSFKDGLIYLFYNFLCNSPVCSLLKYT